MIQKKRLHWLLIGVGGGLMLLDLLFYFGVLAPVRRAYASHVTEHTDVLRRLSEKKSAVSKLENIQWHLQNASGAEVHRFDNYLWDTNDGFSSVIQFLTDATDKNAIQKGRSSFKTANQADAGLLEVKIDLPLEGTYPDVVKFINALERCDHVLVIDTITFQTGQENPGLVRLSLSMLTYLRAV